MTAGRRVHFNQVAKKSERQPVLYLSLELSCETWKLAFATAPDQPARRRDMPARNLPMLWQEIAEGKRRLKLPAD